MKIVLQNYLYYKPVKTAENHTPPTLTLISSPIAQNVNCVLAMPHIINNPLPYEVRKVQNTSHLAMISVPKRFADNMHIQKGSLVKIQYDKIAGVLVISKVHIDDGEGDYGGASSSSVQIPR